MNKPQVVFIVGPTASGKTTAAIEIAKKLNGEIISADSMQVYRGMDILSAKPNADEQKEIVHHLIDILEPSAEYSAAIFRKKALEIIEQIIGRGKTPLIVGGTGLYIKSLTKGLFTDNGKDDQLRKELTQEAKHKGHEHLYKRLKHIDPKAADKIHQNDMRRVIRALEVFEVRKRTISELKTEIQGLEEKYDYKIFGIDRDRRELYQRIDQRVDQMFEAGFLDEVKELLSGGLSDTARQALGIKQISEFLKNNCTLDVAKELIKRDSRRFAKRQLTWFRQDKDIIWTQASDETNPQQIAEKIISLLSL